MDLRLQAGECVCLSGPSGSGKTLLLRAIADLDPHQGTAYLEGAACVSMRPYEWRRQVGLLPAESFWWSDRVGDHFPDGDAEPWLERLGFTPGVMDWNVARLSSGERQRLALARLLVRGPRVLLLDEPTANLDPDNGGRVEGLLADYRRERGAGLLWVSHDPKQIARVADRHMGIRDGRLVPCPPEEAVA